MQLLVVQRLRNISGYYVRKYSFNWIANGRRPDFMLSRCLETNTRGQQETSHTGEPPHKGEPHRFLGIPNHLPLCLSSLGILHPYPPQAWCLCWDWMCGSMPTTCSTRTCVLTMSRLSSTSSTGPTSTNVTRLHARLPDTDSHGPALLWPTSSLHLLLPWPLSPTFFLCFVLVLL